MNKIFKVIWNHATQSWTVGSELSKAHKKQSSVKQVAKLSVLAASLVTASGVMAAESAKPVITAYDRGGLAIGTDHVTDQSLNGATQTVGATVTAYDGIAMGNGSHAGGENGQGGNGHIAIGLMAKATGNGANISQAAVALGSYSRALGGSSTALGQQAYAGIDTNRGSYQNNGNFTTAVGAEAKAMGQSTTALGMQAQATYDRATALGRSAQATSNHATAVGTSAAASKQATVALGTFSKADADFAIAIGGATTGSPNKAGLYQAAKASGNSSISIGIITETTGRNAIAIGRESAAKSNHSVAIGYKASSTNSQYATAIGSESEASAQFAFAAGPKSIANIQDGVALGSDSKTTVNKGVSGFNQNTTTRNERSVLNKYASLTDKTLTSTKAGVSVGSDSHTRQINNLAAGTVDTDAVNVAQLKSVNLQIAGNETANNGADVRLWDQGLTVKGEDNSFISTKADNNTITISTKKADVTVVDGKAVAPTTTNEGVVTGSKLASTVNSLYWTATADNGKDAKVHAGAKVKFKSADPSKLTIEQTGTDDDAVIKFTPVSPTVYTNKDGDKLVQVNGKFYKAADVENGALKQGIDETNAVDAEDVVVSMNNPSSTTEEAGNPVELRNIAEGTKTLAFDKDGNPLVEIDGKFYKLNDDGKTADTTTEIKPATPEELKALADKNVGNLAAAVSGLADLEHSDPTSAITVADAKKLGWVVSTNEDYSEAVSHLDEVRFNNGNGITITGKTNEQDKTIRDITIEVKSADTNTLTVDANGVKVNTGSIKPAEESGNNKGKVTVADADKNKVATVENVANAINSAKWFAKANNLETTMTDRAEKGEESASIGAGDEITFEADKNLAVKRNGKTFTYGLAKDIEVDSVTAKNKVTLGEGDKAVQLSADAGALKVADKDGNATQITNVDAGANTMEFDKDGNQLVNVDGTYYVVDPETGLIKLDDSNNPVKGTPATDEELEALAANPTLKSFVAYANAASGLANLENSIETNVLTVADAKNLGWVVSASGNNYAASVTNAREVRFNGVNGVKVTGETNEETGVRNINIGLEAGNVKAEDGNTGKVTGDTNYVTGDQVANAINNSGWKTQATKVVGADGNEVANADQSTAVNPGDTVNYVDGKGTKANVVVTKVEGKPDVVNVSYDLNLNNHLTPVDNTTKSVTEAPVDAETTGKEAATVNDVLNAGWNLQTNNKNVDAVTHADTVNFTSDDGSVVIKPTTDGKTTKLNFSVDTASVANSVIASTKGNASASSTTGKAVVGKDGNADTTAGADAKFATTGDVVNTINNTGWKTKATDGTDVTVNPGDAVNYVDGKGTKANVAVTKVGDQDVVNVSYDVKSADTDTLTVDANGVKVNTGSLVNASTAEGDANRGKVTVNAGDENKVATVKNVADAINSAAWTVKVADSQEAIETSTANDKGASVSAGTTVTHTAGKNLKVKRDGNNVTYALANDVSVNTVTTETATVGKGDAATTISTSKAGDNVTEVKFGDNAGKPVRVTNIANGVKEGDAVNVRQLNDVKANINQNTQAIGKLNDKIDQVEKRGRKGTAIAGAIGMLPQPHTSGKSMVGVATTNYRGEQAVAVGYSRLSDNGKHIIKLSGSSNVSGKKDAMVGAAYGFQW